MASRNTVQRSVIYHELCTLANHPTADQVYDSLHDGYPTISKATVYRTLNKLSDEGVISKVRINNGADCFDHRHEPHYHVRCVSCGKVDDVELPIMHQVEQSAASMCGYEVVGHSLQFDGVCPDCRN